MHRRRPAHRLRAVRQRRVDAAHAVVPGADVASCRAAGRSRSPPSSSSTSSSRDRACATAAISYVVAPTAGCHATSGESCTAGTFDADATTRPSGARPDTHGVAGRRDDRLRAPCRSSCRCPASHCVLRDRRRRGTRSAWRRSSDRVGDAVRLRRRPGRPSSSSGRSASPSPRGRRSRRATRRVRRAPASRRTVGARAADEAPGRLVRDHRRAGGVEGVALAARRLDEYGGAVPASRASSCPAAARTGRRPCAARRRASRRRAGEDLVHALVVGEDVDAVEARPDRRRRRRSPGAAATRRSPASGRARVGVRPALSHVSDTVSVGASVPERLRRVDRGEGRAPRPVADARGRPFFSTILSSM